jgi:hypothetical protein
MHGTARRPPQRRTPPAQRVDSGAVAHDVDDVLDVRCLTARPRQQRRAVRRLLEHERRGRRRDDVAVARQIFAEHRLVVRRVIVALRDDDERESAGRARRVPARRDRHVHPLPDRRVGRSHRGHESRQPRHRGGRRVRRRRLERSLVRRERDVIAIGEQRTTRGRRRPDRDLHRPPRRRPSLLRRRAAHQGVESNGMTVRLEGTPERRR